MSTGIIFLVLSYLCTEATILCLPSVASHLCGVSTCGSHLTMVGFLYGTIIWVYIKPPSQNSQDQDTVAAMLYTAITHLANPFVLSRHSKDIKCALQRLLRGGRVDSWLACLMPSCLSEERWTARSMSSFVFAWDDCVGQFTELQIQLLLIRSSDSGELYTFRPGFPHQCASGTFLQAIYLDLSK